MGQAFADEGYDRLIGDARKGNTTPALRFLREQPIASPQASRYVSDWISVAAWSGLDQEVVQVYERRGTQLALPAATLALVGKSYRNLRQWDGALALYRQARALAPNDSDLWIGETLVLADAGRDPEALASAMALVADGPMAARRHLALGYVHTAAKRVFAALSEISRARSLAPNETDIQRAYADALQAAGLPVPAAEMVRAEPSLLSEAQQRRIQGDIGAELVRLAFKPATTEAERFRLADQALALYNTLQAQWAELPGGAPLDVRRARVDRLGALTARSRMNEAVDEFETLRREGVPIPDYAIRWIAGAYLYLREPEKAAFMYGEVLDRGSLNPEDRKDDASGLFYSWVEAEEMERAVRLSQHTADSMAPRLPELGLIGGVPSGDWVDGQREAAEALGFADDTPQAQLRLEQMLGYAPGNQVVRTALAGIYRARAWPRRAEEELKLAETMDPRAVGVELQQGFTALELQEWRQVDLLADDVVDRFPESRQVQRLDRLRNVHRKAELRVSGYRGLSSNSPVTGNGDYGIDTVLYTPPIGQDWRLFGGAGFGSGKFEEGRGLHRSFRFGVERRVRDNTIEAEVSSHDFGFGHRTGFRLEGTHDVDDHWQFGGAFEKFSRDTPLRAFTNNVTADSATVSARWQASERREWSLSVQPMRFSDGNNRLGVTALGRERLYTAPYLATDLALDLAASHNSRENVPYYNPEADFTMLPRLDISHVMYRHYQTEWRQQLQLGAGLYAQRGFGTGPIAMIGYSQRLRTNDIFEAALGISLTRRPYDGVNERILRATLDLVMRF